MPTINPVQNSMSDIIFGVIIRVCYDYINSELPTPQFLWKNKESCFLKFNHVEILCFAENYPLVLRVMVTDNACGTASDYQGSVTKTQFTYTWYRRQFTYSWPSGHGCYHINERIKWLRHKALCCHLHYHYGATCLMDFELFAWMNTLRGGCLGAWDSD